MESLVAVARQAAQAGGAVLEGFAARQVTITRKGPIDLLTEADTAAEHAIVEMIRAVYPDHQILAEERTSEQTSESPYRWIIDPLDGTTNFAHGFPIYNVSIGLEYEGTCVLGVVYDPTRKEQFVAWRHGGATLNDRPIRPSDIQQLDDALLVTGFAYDVRTSPDNNLEEFCRFTLRAQGVRRTGSAALDLCYVACGRFDGFWERKLNPWDTAAGLVIVQEAGGLVTNWNGGPFSIYDKQILASNGKIHQAMIEVLHM
ncbi:MAG: inositol monophosphatase [Nitrospirae bacterium]|nr:MAG: inositol monophosphatase [Nitrospirota bacterium]